MHKIRVHNMDRTPTMPARCWAVSTSTNSVYKLTSMKITSLCTQNKSRLWAAKEVYLNNSCIKIVRRLKWSWNSKKNQFKKANSRYHTHSDPRNVKTCHPLFIYCIIWLQSWGMTLCRERETGVLTFWGTTSIICHQVPLNHQYNCIKFS